MAIIDPEGLFSGERLAACSDLAQLYWPRCFLGANGYARLELSYKSVISKIFRNFQKPPEKDTLWAVFQEYEKNCLAILYQVETTGVWWCEFATSEKWLRRYKTAKDRNSPAPSREVRDQFQNRLLAWRNDNRLPYQPFQKISEDFGKFPLGVGVGVGDGVGVGVIQEQPQIQIPLAPPAKTAGSTGRKPESKKPSPEEFRLPDWIPAEIWADYVAMRKINKKPMTARAMEIAVSTLDKLRKQGHGPAAVLEQSILNSWQGLFPVRSQEEKRGFTKQSVITGNIAATEEYIRNSREERSCGLGNGASLGLLRAPVDSGDTSVLLDRTGRPEPIPIGPRIQPGDQGSEILAERSGAARVVGRRDRSPNF